jgi:hypothetical protein
MGDIDLVSISPIWCVQKSRGALRRGETVMDVTSWRCDGRVLQGGYLCRLRDAQA